MQFFTTLVLLALSTTAVAQQDTTVKYYNKSWRETTKDSAEYFSKVVKTGENQWRRQDFWLQTNVMQMDGYYEDAATSVSHGYTNFYYASGVLKDSCIYEHDRLKNKLSYHANKNRAYTVSFNSGGAITEQKGWQEDDTPISNFIYQQAAEFPGGPDKWVQYLVKNMRRNQPMAYQKGQISGKVVVSFIITQEGDVAEVSVFNSSGYGDLDRHAMDVISKSPKWIPAIQYNRPVIFRQLQSITYPAAQ